MKCKCGAKYEVVKVGKYGVSIRCKNWEHHKRDNKK